MPTSMRHSSSGRQPVLQFVVLAFFLLVTASSALGQPMLIVPDGTVGLPDGGNSVFFPWTVARHEAGAYTLEASLPVEVPPWVEIDAAWEISTGVWWLSVAQTSDLGGQTFRPADVIAWNVTTHSAWMALSAATLGVPEDANIDALFGDPATGDLVFSFDNATQYGSETYRPADLARYDMTLGQPAGYFFDASAAGIPDDADLIAAQARGPDTVFALDVFVTIGDNTYGPGDLLVWDGTSIGWFQTLPGWPLGARVNGLSFRGLPGVVPPTITVEVVGPNTLRIRYSASECSGASEYGIYQGNLSSLPAYDHTAVDCSDDGTKLQEDLPMAPGNVYFLIVPINQSEEGSYGTIGLGAERPPGLIRCMGTQAVGEC